MIARSVLLLLVALPAWAGDAFYQCVDFPFQAFPRALWERELVWMKNIGVRSVALSPERTSEDLKTVLRLLRRLELTAWVRSDMEDPELETQKSIHGGPIAYWGKNAAPQPVTTVSAISPVSIRSRRKALLERHGTLLWTAVESTVLPAYGRGAISFTADEDDSLGALRRDATLLRYWGPVLPGFHHEYQVQPVAGKFAEGFTTRQIADPAGNSALCMVNDRAAEFRGDLRIYYPPAKRWIALPSVAVPARDSLWLPVNISFGSASFCKNCDALGPEDSLVYATAELTAIEYENGILAMEFNAPEPGEVLLHLSHEPNGPYLAGGKPRSFDWDPSTNRLRLPIPAGSKPGFHVRIGVALDAPDTSAFFGDRKVLMLGEHNTITTTYSSEKVAGRSRLRAPSWLPVKAGAVSPNGIDYDLDVPATALHGDRVELALEADGVQLAHTRLQFLRPASLRLRDSIRRHFGPNADLPVTPALLPVDATEGRSLAITIRNNFPEIRNFILEIAGDGLEFSPVRTEVSIAASSERDVSVRVFPKEGARGLREAAVTLSGAAAARLPVQFVVIPRGGTVAYTADLDGAGKPLYILESKQARAVFSAEHGERWLEWVWKADDREMLPDAGIPLGPVNLKLDGAQLTVEADRPLPARLLAPGKQGEVTSLVERPAPNRAVFTLKR